MFKRIKGVLKTDERVLPWILIAIVATLLLTCAVGCKCPLARPMDKFFNETLGTEIADLLQSDLNGAQAVVKTQRDVDARLMNLRMAARLARKANAE